MSGTVVRKVDGFTSVAVGAPNHTQEQFVRLYDYFQQHVAAGNAVLHALNWGGDGVATGMNYHDEADPAGENAWAVFRFLASASTKRTLDFYVHIQWADAVAFGFGGTEGAPALINNATTDGVALEMAYREDGGDPWLGLSNADGADTKGAAPETGPVWGGTGLHMMDHDNERGSTSTDKQNMRRVFTDQVSADTRNHMVGDADCILIWNNAIDDATVNTYTIFGCYDPIAGIAIPTPFFMANTNAATWPATTTQYGLTGNYYGGLMGFDESDGSRNFGMAALVSGLFSSSYGQPAAHDGSPVYLDIPAYMYQRTGAGSGVIGSIPTNIVTLCAGMPGDTANAAVTRAYLGLVNISVDDNVKLSVNWDGVNPPNSSSTREGVNS
jgi:hypothetical protein